MTSTSTLSEHESKALLARYGVPHAPERLVDSPDTAAAAADELGYPVAVKLCGASIAHKTERGLVRLGLGDRGAVAGAAAAVLAAAGPDDGDVGVLVSAMVKGNRELIAGCVDGAVFGRCVMLGVGGILAEAIRDVTFRITPLARVDAEEMVEDLATQALLGPFRGEPAVDRAALADVVMGLGEAFTAEADAVSIDVNPLIVVDGRPVAVDALVEVQR